MSVKVMGLIWDHYPNGGGELLTALKLADHADHHGDRIWPGVASIARMTMQSERTVQRHLQAMLQSGWLVRVQEGGKGPADTTRYRIPIEAIPQGVDERVTKLHPSQASIRVTVETAKGDIHDIKGDTAMSPESSLKQSSVKQPSLPLLAPSPKSRGNGAAGNPKVYIPVNDGSEYGVTDLQIEEFTRLYPAVDVPQTLNEIRGWNLTHPQRRKTRRGILSHINGWLAKEQNRGPQAG